MNYDDMIELINNKKVGIRTYTIAETEALFQVLEEKGFCWHPHKYPLTQVLHLHRGAYTNGNLFGLAMNQKYMIWRWGAICLPAGESEMDFSKFSARYKINLNKGGVT